MKANYVEDCGIIFEPETTMEEFALRKLKEKTFDTNIIERIAGTGNKGTFILKIVEEDEESVNPFHLEHAEADRLTELTRRM